MKVYRRHVNDYPFVDSHQWEFQPLAIIKLFLDNDGSNHELSDAVRNLDHIYVKFRELDALENRIGRTFEGLRNGNEINKTDFPEGFHNVFDALKTVVEAKKSLIEGANKQELTRGRECLLQMVSYLETKGIVEVKA